MKLSSSRRGFLTLSTAAMGANLFADSSANKVMSAMPKRKHAHMGDFKCAPLEKVHVGVIGTSGRGCDAVRRLSVIPGTRVLAVGDLFENRATNAVNIAVKSGHPAPYKTFGSVDAWKKICEDKDVNLIYIVTPWQMHVEMVMYAMECGKHVACEVSMCFTVEEAWRIVNKAEEKRVHCMLLENCCYGESELLALNMIRNDVLGTLVHGEGAYIHDLRGFEFNTNDNDLGYEGLWRLKWNKMHTGNPYATHGLGPICQYMNIGHGDRMTHLSAMSTNEFGRTEYVVKHKDRIERMKKMAKGNKYGMSDVAALTGPWEKGDMCTAIIKTEMGRTIMVQHDVTSPRPYSRINLISGTKGILKDYPLEISFSHGWLRGKAKTDVTNKWKHPLWKGSGDFAKKIGGHGGMDFLMDLRLSYCLQNGLPLDINVYDSVLWSSLAEMTEYSSRNNGASIEVPDYTRGAYKTIAPLGIETVKMNLGDGKIDGKSIQLNV